MKTMTLEKQVLARIQKQHVRPTPKGWFKARDYLVWALLAVFVAALGLSFGMIIFSVKSADFGLFAELGLTTYERIAAAVPIFWILSALLGAGIAYLSFRKTRKGYKTSTKRVVAVTILIGAATGAVAYAFNLSGYLNDAASKNIPLYHIVVPVNTSSWFDPDHGLLSGLVRSKDVGSFILRDLDGEIWTVDATNAEIPQGYDFHPGDRLKIVGKRTGEDAFRATDIHPWTD